MSWRHDCRGHDRSCGDDDLRWPNQPFHRATSHAQMLALSFCCDRVNLIAKLGFHIPKGYTYFAMAFSFSSKCSSQARKRNGPARPVIAFFPAVECVGRVLRFLLVDSGCLWRLPSGWKCVCRRSSPPGFMRPSLLRFRLKVDIGNLQASIAYGTCQWNSSPTRYPNMASPAARGLISFPRRFWRHAAKRE